MAPNRDTSGESLLGRAVAAAARRLRPDDRLDRSTLRDEANEQASDPVPNLTQSALSAVVATGGLLLGSPVALVGAMVISPFATTTLAVAVGAVADDADLLVENATLLAAGAVVSAATAAAVTAAARATGFVPASLVVTSVEEVRVFTAPTLFAALLAFAAGAAGGVVAATDQDVNLPGVAAAAAVVPSLAAAGTTAVWGRPAVAVAALVFFSLNALLVTLGYAAVFVAYGYGAPFPRGRPIRGADEPLRTVARVALVVALLGAAVGGVAGGTAYVTYERTANLAVDRTLSGADALRLRGVRGSYAGLRPFGDPAPVTVSVARPVGRRYPGLAGRVERRIERATGVPTEVTVEFSTYDPAPSPAGVVTRRGEKRENDRTVSTRRRMSGTGHATLKPLSRRKSSTRPVWLP
ncbi:DUF389 domain-containing protein [Candidatus Halobonum tyrrellensis]|uniref:DUF389 domain-containing protein n=1 Tax=Candidatus Halobonum tyrrellensis G22 TaxID=1324957 RepID=V4IVR4_9EURY|nr:DUF389 domain-containing protein [Candidatus Halobonum tyrrellensis]ESP87287.1 hypothetical protein K933_14413 [Candidatus Halobonum tyrrellensis G22]